MDKVIIISCIIALMAVTTTHYRSKKIIEESAQKNADADVSRVSAVNESTLPILWLYYDQSEVNSRYWNDFGSRSSRVLHSPFLNLCYESIILQNGQKNSVRVIAGLSDLAILLGGWHELPKPLQNPIAPVGEAELNYIRATLLRRFGGLWINPSCIFMKPLPEMKEKSVFFGTDKDETYMHEGIPATDVMFSPEPNTPLFMELESLAVKRIERHEGGKQFRKDIKWDLTDIMKKYEDTIEYIPTAEFSRKSNGKRIQLEDLLGSNNIPICPRAVYAPIDWEELQKRRNFGWFLRMSEEQIYQSELYISQLFAKSQF